MRLASISLLVLMLARPLSAESPITLKVRVRFQQAPGYQQVTLLIPRDTASRQVCVVIDGENYYRSSCYEHVGDGAPYQTVLEYKDLPAGHYTAQAELVREVKGGRVSVTTPVEEFRVLGLGEEPDPDEN